MESPEFSLYRFLKKETDASFFASLVDVMGKGQETRQRIIEQAAPLFNRGGMAGCSMQDILHATGLKKGGLYGHFPSKEALAAECLKYSLALVFQARSGNAEHIPNSIDKLRYLVKRFVSTPSPMKGGCPLMNAAVDSDDGDPQLRRISLEALRAWKSRLLQILKEGIERGEVVSGTDPERVVNTVIAILEGSLLIGRIERSSGAMEDARVHLDTFFDGLVPTTEGLSKAAENGSGTTPAKSFQHGRVVNGKFRLRH
jgi:TetR/AcrR family transcriptional regulator, transcriptional repressor for nem operon